MRYGREDLKMSLIAGLILAALTVAAGVSTYWVMQHEAKVIIDRNLSALLQNDVHLFEQELKRGIHWGGIVATRPFVIASLKALDARPHTISARNHLRQIARTFLPTGLAALTFYDAHNRLVAQAGHWRRPTLGVPLHHNIKNMLFWDRQLLIQTNVPVLAHGQLIGHVMIQTPLPFMRKMLPVMAALNSTADLAMCAPKRGKMQCFPDTFLTRLHRQFHGPIPLSIHGRLVPMARALRGQTGLVYTRDYQDHSVVAAYAPVGTTGLGMVLKIRQLALFKAVTARLKEVMVLLVVLLLIGILMIRGLILPLLGKRSATEAKLRESEVRAHALLAHVGDGIIVMDEDGIIEIFNPAAEQIFGYAHSQMVGTNISRLILEPHGRWRTEGAKLHRQTRGSFGIGLTRAATGVRRNGDQFPVEMKVREVRDGAVHLFIAVVRDITSENAAAQRALYLATHDPLTDLPNRALLIPHIESSMARTRRHERILAVAMLDLDDFKLINDRYGHAAGDVLLTQLAVRLQQALRQTDFVARLGGDEFVLLFEDLKQIEDLDGVMAKIRDVIEEPYTLPGGPYVTVQASLGLTYYPFDDASPDQLLRHADQALYASKDTKRDRLQFWSSYHVDMVDREDATLRHNVSALLAAGGLRTYYQPMIALESGLVVGVEALARLVNDAGDVLTPGYFLPLLSGEERRGLTQATLTTALRDLGVWDKAGFAFKVSINVEPKMLTHDACLHCLADVIGPSGIDPTRITLEILEYEDFLSLASAHQRILEIKATGVRLAIDDVGSAYSSLLRLKELPIDEVKLDQDFVRGLVQWPENLHFVRSLLGLARGLGVDFVAEGVESPEIRDALSAMGVVAAQGYAIAHPMSAADLSAWLQAYRPIPWQGPQTLLGLYACHLRFSDVVKMLYTQMPKLETPALLEIISINPMIHHIARLHLDSTPLAQAHGRYQAALMAIPRDGVSGQPDFTGVDQASQEFLVSIREGLETVRR